MLPRGEIKICIRKQTNWLSQTLTACSSTLWNLPSLSTGVSGCSGGAGSGASLTSCIGTGWNDAGGSSTSTCRVLNFVFWLLLLFILLFFRSGTDLISLLILFLFFLFLLGDLFNKPKTQSFQIGPEWNLAGLFFNTHRLTKSDFCYSKKMSETKGMGLVRQREEEKNATFSKTYEAMKKDSWRQK